MNQLHSPAVARSARVRVILGSPFLCGALEAVQRDALRETQRVFRLDRGELGRAVERLIETCSPPEHKLDLLRALAQSDPRQGPFWREVWPRLAAHYQIEMGTLLMLRQPRMNEAVAALVDGLTERKARIDVMCGWSSSLLDVLQTVLVPHLYGSGLLEATDRASLGQGAKGMWIGSTGQGANEARRRGHSVLGVETAFHKDHLMDVIAFVESHGKTECQPGIRLA
jgi:hypothetical protein